MRKIIKDSPSKSCSLDPLPPWLLKQCQDTLLPVITEIVNLSLSTAIFPGNCKEAILTPLIKKILQDPEKLLPHLKPTFYFQNVEKVVAMYVRDYMTANGLHELFQSAYKKLHSPETALLYVQDALLRALDNQQAAVLVLLLLTLLITIF